MSQIIAYRNDWFLWPLSAVLLGVLFWVALTAKVKGHVKGLLGKLGYLAFPYLPRRMLVIDRDVFYDDEYTVVEGDGEYEVQTIYGVHYKTTVNPDEHAIIVNGFNARGPEGVDSPFSMAWRWILVGSIMLYLVSMGLLQAWMDPRLTVLKWLEVFGYSVPSNVAVLVSSDRAENIVYAGLLTALAGAWWLANLYKFTSKSIRLSRFVSLTNDKGVTRIIPALDPDSPTGTIKVLRSITRVELTIPEEFKDFVNRLSRIMNKDVTLVAQLLNKAAMADFWRKEIGDQNLRYLAIKRAAEAECRVKNRFLNTRMILSMTKVMLVVAVTVGLIGLGVGYLLGASLGTPSVHHVNNTATPVVTPSPEAGQETPVVVGNTTVTPAPMPAPPVGGVSGG